VTDRRDPSPHNALIRYWVDLYAELRGVKYPFMPRDAKVIKDLRAMYPDDELQTLMRGYLEMDDDWLEDKGRPLHLMPGSLTKVLRFVRGDKPRTAPVSKAVVEPMKAWLEQKKASGM
jgi:hypothetical protein